MKSLNEILKEAAREVKYRGRYDGDIDIEEFHDTPRLGGVTNLVTKDITISHNPEYEKEKPGRTVIAVKDISKHEINHHRYLNCIGCPQTVDKHVELFHEPMSDVLLNKGYSSTDVDYVTNVLEDTLLQYDLHRNDHSTLEGIKDFFEEVAIYTPAGKNGKHKFTKFYEAHVKLNMYLWGNKQQKKTLQKYYTHDKQVTEVLQAFLEKTKRYDYLNENNWKKISQIYAEEFSKLMEPGYSMPIFNHSGKGTKGKEQKPQEGKKPAKDKESGEEQERTPEPVREGNIFDKEMDTKDYKKARIKKAHYSNDKIPNWINNYEAMDLLYESLAQKLEIKSKAYTEEEQMPISWYGKRDFNPEQDNLKHTTFGFDENGNMGLRKKKFHEDLPINIKSKPESFPKMRFGLLDTSQSMEWDVYDGNNVGRTNIIPWGDRSKYHYALLGWYGFLEYLKANHLLRQNTVDLANFSSETHIGKGLVEAKKIALKPQFDNTYIDHDKIKYFFEGRDNLIFTISDGAIMNWSSIRDEFIKNAKKHQYFHIQIGEHNSVTREMENEGLYVCYVKGDNDLVNKVIDLTDKMFRRTK